MKIRFLPSLALFALATALPGHAEERTLTPEQMEQLANSGDFTGDEEIARPKNLPDLTKYDPLPTGKAAPPIWTLGPTGIVGQMIDRRMQGDQILVKGTMKGSPAEGKLQPGDVLIGMNGAKFVSGGHLGELIGHAIIKAELPENEGGISFLVWRDRNFASRNSTLDVASLDIDKLFNEARDDNTLYDWKPEEERASEVKRVGFDKFPIDPVTLEIDLQLGVLPPYADTAPYDCPKTNRILEDAWKVLEKKFEVTPENPKSGRGGVIEAIALIASGKPGHRQIVHDWVRGKHSPWKPPTEPIGEMFKPGYKGYKGYQSWHKGYAGLYCALYYEATGDDYVLPALRKYAIETAMGQSWAGSWGHTFAYPSFNGGKLHQMNPGYGALNAAGNRCFFLITLARKLGVEHPEIDLAIERAQRFFGSYADQGCIPYGDHPAYNSDDSNGKNSGVAFSLKLLGDKRGAKYFAMMSSHCAFTRRGGHGHDYHGNWSSWAATLCGPEVRQLNERNLRWRRTLCRMHDGGFVYNSPTGGYNALRDPTATEVLHQAAPMKQTLITGKDPDETLYPTGREMKQLLASAAGSFNDPWLREKAGTRWSERGTDELFDMLDIFFPKARAAVAAKLGERFLAGEKDIAARLVALLGSESARFREGALRGLGACGTDTVLSSLSGITKLLEDPEDFVRITAVKIISKATDQEEAQLAMLKATVSEPRVIAPNSVRNATQAALFGKDHLLANQPFEAGFDGELVRQALEGILLTDPGGADFLGSRQDAWTRDTVVRIAGPLTYIAEEEQIADQMFGNRAGPARAMLGKFNYREAAEAGTHLLRKKAAIPRHTRPFVGFKDALVDPFAINGNPGAFRSDAEFFKIVLTDNPNETVVIRDDRSNWKPLNFNLNDLLARIEGAKGAATMPSLADDAGALFRAELKSLAGTGARLKACRAELADPARKNTFRKITAMETLVEILDIEALPELAPYLGDEYWRLRDCSRSLAVNLVKAGGAADLAELLRNSDDPAVKSGALAVFSMSASKEGEKAARSCLKDASPVVRGNAVKTLATIGGRDVLPEVLAHFAAAREADDLSACEEALLVGLDDPDRTAAVRDGLLEILPGIDPSVRPSLYYVISRIGDAPSIAALRKAGKTDSLTELEEIVLALSYSPSREADALMLEIAATGKASARIAGAQGVRRMVLGPKGFGDISSSDRMDFAEAMLKLSLDRQIIAYLGRIYEARALRALMFCLEKGIESAAGSLISAAEGMENLSATDAKIAAKSLQDVIEYIEVTRLRGGVSAHMDMDDNYTGWKLLQARAGKALLKVHQPETAPIPEFDLLELND